MAERAPYPGLRPFRRNETDLFFGRDGNVDEIIDRLAATRFVAVLGASGSGKSSIVRTGVLEGLELGLLRTVDGTTSWQVADLRPGDRPIANLARALLQSTGKGDDDPTQVEALAAMLRRGPRSILDWCAAHLKEKASLLILVDQFEELFGYQSYSGQDQAQAFVRLLIESVQQTGRPRDAKRLPIYVVLTMRSEYLGACALIDGLAEEINRGQYLTPRLTREQCRMAIEEPAALLGVKIEPELVNRLLNDLAAFAPWDETAEQSSQGAADSAARTDNLERLARRADQLPLLQHVLNRLWTRSVQRGDKPPALTLADYQGNGALRGMLSGHADEILQALVEKHGKQIELTTETIFRALVSGPSIAAAVRRPTRIGELAKLTGDRDGVLAVVEAYRAPGCNFLVSGGEKLTDDVVVDISHESLIRQWSRLRGWVETEAASGVWWHDIADRAKDWKKAAEDEETEDERRAWMRLWQKIVEKAGLRSMLLRGSTLAQALQLLGQYRPTAAWSERYGGGYADVVDFLGRSQRAARRRQVFGATVVGTVLVVFGAMLALAYGWLSESENRKVSDAKLNGMLLQILTSEVKRHQGNGEVYEAGGLLASFFAPILTGGDANLQQPPVDDAQRQALANSLREQYLAMRRVDRNHLKELEKVDPPKDPGSSGLRDLETLTPGGAGAGLPALSSFTAGFDKPSLLAAIYPDEIKVYRSGDDDAWADRKVFKIANLVSPAAIGSSEGLVVAGYARGGSLAIIANDTVYFGKLDDLERSSPQSARIERLREDAVGSRELEKGAPPPKPAEFRRLHSCSNARPTFLAVDKNRTAWLLTLEDGRAYAAWVGQNVRAWSIAPGGDRYAVASDERVYVGECRVSLSEREAKLTEVPNVPQGTLRDIELTEPNLLAVVTQPPAGEIAQIQLIDIARWTSRPGNITFIPKDDYFRIAPHGRVWLKRDKGKALVLRNLSTGADEATAQLPDESTPEMVGMSLWIVTASKDGRLVLRFPVFPTDLPMEGLAKLVVSAGGGTISQSMAGYIHDSHVVLGAKPRGDPASAASAGADPFFAGLSSYVRELLGLPADKPARASVDCRRALRSLTDVLERYKDTERTNRSAQLAGDIRQSCPLADMADNEERALLAWLLEEILAKRELVALRERAAPLAASGSAIGLRLLAITFDPSPEVAKALDLAAAKKSREIPYRVLRMARDNFDSVREIEMTGTVESPKYPNARYQEMLGLLLEHRNKPEDAIRRFAAAQQMYRDSGDDEGVNATGQERWKIAAIFRDNELIALWDDLKSQVHAPPPEAATGNAPGTAGVRQPTSPQQALEKVAMDFGPLIKGELLLAASDIAADPKGKVELLRSVAAAVEQARQSGIEDADGLSYRLAVAFERAKLPEEAAAVIAGYLVEVGLRAQPVDLTKSVNLRDVVRLARVRDAIRLASRTNVAVIPEARERIGGMSWNFLNYRWSSRRDDLLLAEAQKLQDALTKNGVQTDALRLARARTLFWLGVSSSAEEAKRSYFERSADLFDDLKSADPETRLQWADAVRSKASVMPLDSPTVDAAHALAVVNERERAHGLYEALLKDLSQPGSPSKDDVRYLQTATVSGLSSALQGLATASAIATAKMIVAPGREAREAAYRQAVNALRTVRAQRMLFGRDRYKDIASANPATRNLCCLGPESQGEDAWVVALVAGAARLPEVGGSRLGECEKRATHPYDPRRRTIGGAVGADAIAACEAEEGSSTAAEDPGRHAFLLGRAYANDDARRNEAVMQLARAADGGYAQAYYNLFYELNQSGRCSLAPALLARYRYLVMRDFLSVAMSELEPYFEPSDNDLIEDMKDVARREPWSPVELPRIGAGKIADLLKDAKCEWVRRRT